MSGCYDMSGGPMDEETRAKITAYLDAHGGPGDDPELRSYYEPVGSPPVPGSVDDSTQREKLREMVARWRQEAVNQQLGMPEHAFQFVRRSGRVDAYDRLLSVLGADTGGEHGPNRCVPIAEANRVLAEERAVIAGVLGADTGAGEGAPPMLCPKCKGQGVVGRPSYVPWDAQTWMSTTTGAYRCDLCDGRKVIDGSALASRPGDTSTVNGEQP
jgi:hypothetical protein